MGLGVGRALRHTERSFGCFPQGLVILAFAYLRGLVRDEHPVHHTTKLAMLSDGSITLRGNPLQLGLVTPPSGVEYALLMRNP